MKINLWQTTSGGSPVTVFIESQGEKAAARIMKDVDHLEEQGMNLLATKKLKQLRGYENLYELITNFKGAGYRIIFTIINGDAWLLEAFKKKSNETPKRFIDNAVTRRRQLISVTI